MPEILYHYTNVEVLALILKNCEIKFNPLTKMDDTQEQLTSDYQNLGNLCFVSSWTDNINETIPMWRMYCPKNSGIRISLPLDPFVKYSDSDYARNHGLPSLKLREGALGRDTIISFREQIEKNFVLADIHGEFMVTKVEYDNDENKLIPKIIFDDTRNINVKILEYGLYKNTHWRFQDEWRYRLFPLPMPMLMLGQPNMFKNTLMSKFRNNNLNLPFDSLFLKIRDDCFKKMEITMSPNISPGYQIIIENLIKEYNPDAQLNQSTLHGLIN